MTHSLHDKEVGPEKVNYRNDDNCFKCLYVKECGLNTFESVNKLG